jgi:hypothetical protein
LETYVEHCVAIIIKDHDFLDYSKIVIHSVEAASIYLEISKVGYVKLHLAGVICEAARNIWELPGQLIHSAFLILSWIGVVERDEGELCAGVVEVEEFLTLPNGGHYFHEKGLGGDKLDVVVVHVILRVRALLFDGEVHVFEVGVGLVIRRRHLHPH